MPAIATAPQLFKILAPYAILAVCFALLNALLHLPPFSLFLVALTLTDGTSPPPPHRTAARDRSEFDPRLVQ